MTFEHWLNEAECFSIREDRLDDDFSMLDQKDYNKLRAWLKAAWFVGHEHALSTYLDDGK